MQKLLTFHKKTSQPAWVYCNTPILVVGENKRKRYFSLLVVYSTRPINDCLLGESGIVSNKVSA